MYVEESDTEGESDRNMKINVTPWHCDTNWIVADGGSLKSSITVDSSVSPISESDSETIVHKWPVGLKPPRGPDSGPCDIRICFEQKFEIRQIYVRSTARVYEVYYANSPQGIDEYLCTVRCGVAERDEKLLQTTCIEDVAEEHREYASGELTEESVTDGRNILTSEDDWVKIKALEVGRDSSSDMIDVNKEENVQDLYEATAQISDADPCSSLTIRLLSLQDKGHLYVDEIYVFVDPIESTGSENEAVLASSSAQSSLIAMFVPTLLQLSKSGVRQVQDKIALNEVLKDDKTEIGSCKSNEIDAELESNKVDQHYVKSKELDDDRANSVELQQPNLAVNMKPHIEPIHVNDLPHGHLERALEQLISRVSRVEDICLRFEQKILKPIENMEVRLQQVENQLEKLAKNSISAPEFPCSESKSSSLYNDRSDNPPSRSDLSRDAKFQPSLVVTAPEFSCGEDEAEEKVDLEPLKESPCIKPKKTLSVDDALAAALSEFLSTAKVHPSCKVDEENQKGQAESCQSKAQECSDTENDNMESLEYTQILTVKALDFPVEEIIDVEKNLNHVKSPDLNLDNGHLNKRSDFNTMNCSVEGDETNPKKTICCNHDVDDIDTKRVLGHEPGSVSDDVQNKFESSCASLLDFEFPILEVKFTSDVSEQTNIGNQSSDFLPSNDLLVDFSYSSADRCSKLEVESQNACTPSIPELNVSLEALHKGTSKNLFLSRNVKCSKCKGKGSKSFVFGNLKRSKSVKCCRIRQTAPCMIHQSIDCPQNKLENVVSEDDMQGGVQCAQQ